MNAARTLLGFFLVALGGWFLWSVFAAEPATDSPARTFTSSAQCAECHAEQYEEWQGSQHAMSWVNPRVVKLSNDFSNQNCIDCHAPRSVFETGIGERVLPRAERRVEGVDCIACHELPGGGFAGTLDDPRAACRPQLKVELTRPVYCAGCHNQHKTVDQYRASEWPERGEDCLSCHMPHRDGDPTKGRSHAFVGGTSLAMLQRAVDLRGKRENDQWIVELENVGAGHSYPTDERSRASDLFWRPLGEGSADERGPWRHLYRIRDPYRTEVDLPSTLVHAHDTLVVPLEDAEAQGAVEVALFYMREPYWDDPKNPDPEAKATLVHRLELTP